MSDLKYRTMENGECILLIYYYSVPTYFTLYNGNFVLVI